MQEHKHEIIVVPHSDCDENEQIEDEGITYDEELLSPEAEKIRNEVEQVLLTKKILADITARSRFIDVTFNYISSNITDTTKKAQWQMETVPFDEVNALYQDAISMLSNDKYDDTSKLISIRAYFKVLLKRGCSDIYCNHSDRKGLNWFKIERTFWEHMMESLNNCLQQDLSASLSIGHHYKQEKLKTILSYNIKLHTEKRWREIDNQHERAYESLNKVAKMLLETSGRSDEDTLYHCIIKLISLDIITIYAKFYENSICFKAIAKIFCQVTLEGNFSDIDFIDKYTEYLYTCDASENFIIEKIKHLGMLEIDINKQNESISRSLPTPTSVAKKKHRSKTMKVPAQISSQANTEISLNLSSSKSQASLSKPPAILPVAIRLENDEQEHKHEVVPSSSHNLTITRTAKGNILSYAEHIRYDGIKKQAKDEKRKADFLEKLCSSQDKSNKITVSELENFIFRIGGKVTVASKASHRRIELPSSGTNCVSGYLLEEGMASNLETTCKKMYGAFFKPHGSKDRSKGLLTGINRRLAIDAFTRAGYVPQATATHAETQYKAC